MPIGIDPHQRTTFILKPDEPAEGQPSFECRFLTTRECREVARLIDAALNESDQAKADAAIMEALKIGITGWSGVTDRDGKPIPFSFDSLDGESTFPAKCAIGWAMLRAVRLSSWDFFASAKPSSSPPGSSVSPGGSAPMGQSAASMALAKS